jgi:hypothetical protein
MTWPMSKPVFTDLGGWTAEDWLADWEERAAIIQTHVFIEGPTARNRIEAERIALEQVNHKRAAVLAGAPVW